MIGTTISHYKILEKLGEGGMGVVYKAEDSKLERPVALKFLAAHLLNDDEAKRRFLREAKAAAALHHPNICTVYEVDEAEGITLLAMALIEGESLEARIEKGPLPLQEALAIGRQVADGLQAAHAKTIIHRDIKPANIMVSPEGRATIMDFGLAQLTEASRLTRKDTILGTAAYMSPEQAQGAEVDQSSDIWALGCVLYEMVAGARAFKGAYNPALLYEIVHETPEPLTAIRSGLPMELEFIVDKCLAKEPAQRYRHAEELALDLESLREKFKSGKSTIQRTQPGAGLSQAAAQPPAPFSSSLAPGAQPRPDTQYPEVLSGELVPNRKLRLQDMLFAATVVALLALSFIHFRETAPEVPLRRFAVKPPEALDALDFGSHAAISPDGRHIALTTGGPQFNSLQTEAERDEQKGFMFLFKGIVGLRNSKAHSNRLFNDPYRAHDYLALASVLMRVLEIATVNRQT